MAKKLYYKIGEACKRLDIQPYVLRYWETEFPLLAPSKSTSGQRTYSEQDLRVIQRIKELLYEEGYTIAGAKKKLEKQDLSSLGELRDPTPKKAPEKAPKKADDKAVDEVPDAEAAPEKDQKPEPGPKAKSKRKAKPKKEAAAVGASEAKLRRGIREALKEARAIQDLLDS